MATQEPENERGSASGQGVERLASIMRVLGERSRTGSRLTDIADNTGLSKSTVHRLLASMVSEGLVDTDETTNLFYLGFGTFSLGLAAGNRFGLVEMAREQVDWLEQRTGDTVFVSVRSGPWAICVDRAAGSYPIKVLTLNVGDRRPLGVGAGSLALLAGLDDATVAETIAVNAKELGLYAHFTSKELKRLVARTRRDGFSFNDGGVIPGMQALGVAVPARLGPPRVALSIAAIAERIAGDRRDALLADLRSAAHKIGERLASVATARIAL